MPNTNQHADATLALTEREEAGRRREAALNVLTAHAEANEWPEEDFEQVKQALDL
jgi:hypothetical protein